MLYAQREEQMSNGGRIRRYLRMAYLSSCYGLSSGRNDVQKNGNMDVLCAVVHTIGYFVREMYLYETTILRKSRTRDLLVNLTYGYFQRHGKDNASSTMRPSSHGWQQIYTACLIACAICSLSFFLVGSVLSQKNRIRN